jgi:tyrosyl-tRNA synthetase
MGNYHPILMKFDTQTKKNMLSSKVTIAEMIDRFQDGRRRHVGNSSACYKMGNYHPILMKIGTQTKQNRMIECKSHKSRSLRQKNSKN